MEETETVVEEGQETPEPVESTPTEETSDLTPEPETVEPESKQSQAVPYERFTEVNERARIAEEKAARYEAYLASLQGQQQQPNYQTEDGEIDPVAYKEAIKAEIRRETEMLRSQEKAWAKAESKYPELADPDIRDAVEGKMNKALLGGELLSPEEAASRVLGKIQKKTSEAREQGRKEAQVSERIVNRAQMAEPSNPTAKGPSRQEELQRLMQHPDERVAEKARLEYLSIQYPRS